MTVLSKLNKYDVQKQQHLATFLEVWKDWKKLSLYRDSFQEIENYPNIVLPLLVVELSTFQNNLLYEIRKDLPTEAAAGGVL